MLHPEKRVPRPKNRQAYAVVSGIPLRFPIHVGHPFASSSARPLSANHCAVHLVGSVLSFDRALAYLPEQLQAFVAGSTYHRRRFTRDEWFQHHRYQQIAQPVQRHHIAEWLALDDDVDGWPDTARHRLAECDGVHGVSHQWPTLDTWLDKVAPLPTANPAP